jgi:nitrite reductase/ring-hydroxylating ferredoxin subunit
MITEEENNLLIQTGKGTPCGELMRRYWQPAALAEELAVDKPFPVQLFGEELILFRDGTGKPALIGRYCAHQGVDMIYGRVEPDGLRCMYHGWLFDTCGKVLLRGDWLPEKERRWDVGQPSYPCVEACGIIFVYMGPGDAPLLPPYEFLAEQPAGRPPTKVLRAENYLRGIADGKKSPAYGAKFIMPNMLTAHAIAPGSENSLRWHVAVDDDSHVEFTVSCGGDGHFSDEPEVSPRQALLEVIEIVRAERQAPPESSEKI